jgi:malate dehydrogenase (oxaloacetate-decarboxylating)(NADP+)
MMNSELMERHPSAEGGAQTNAALFNDPALNKGTAFAKQERRRYGLEGLIPQAVETLDCQLERIMGHLDARPTDLERYIYLVPLACR